MYTSDIDRNRSKAAKTALVYLMISTFCALFGAIYEVYSHEVYSFYMIYAFAFPLVGGALSFLLLHIAGAAHYPGVVSRHLFHCGIATLTVGSIIQGVVEIYGTTNSLTAWYWRVGAVLIVAGSIAFLFQRKQDKESD